MINTSIIKQPVVSEKSIALAAAENKYTFMVAREANKLQIKAAVEALYGVQVTAVNTKTSYRHRKATGRKRMRVVVAPKKMALVSLKKGQSIPVFDFGGETEGGSK